MRASAFQAEDAGSIPVIRSNEKNGKKGREYVATRRQIQEDLRQQCGNLISFGKLCKYLGMCAHAGRDFLADVPSYEIGNKKCYLAIDIAKKLEAAERPAEIA